MTQATRVFVCLTVLAVLLLSLATPAAAWTDEPKQDVVKLIDGRELTGTIVKKQSGYIWLDTGEDQPIFLSPDKITEILWSDPPAVEPEKQRIEDAYIFEPWERVEGVTRAVVLSAEGTVGMQMSAKPLREALPMLREEGIDLVVLKIDSGGGLLLGIQDLTDVLHNEYKQEFELVGLVGASLSAAATVTMAIEELYFEPGGNLGYSHSCWGHSCFGRDKSSEDAYKKINAIAVQCGADAVLVNAIHRHTELSYSIDPVTDEVSLFGDLTGEHQINDGTFDVMLDSDQAESIGLSLGTAKTLDELTIYLEQNHGTIEWIGKDIEGYDYPVCKAERHQIRYRENIDHADALFVEIYTKCQMEISNAQGVELEKRGGFLRRAGAYLACIKRMVKINPELALLNIPDGWLEAQEEIIRELREE